MPKPPKGEHEHYLEQELYALVQNDPTIFDFLQAGSLDGIWYWDLENVEIEWMSDRFWTLFGYDPVEKKHEAAEWQDMIHPDDLKLALKNFEAHCADPNHSYDQIVRYRHKDGSTVWVQCRGLAIRDRNGKPIRMLGAHTDVTELKTIEAKLAKQVRQTQRSNEALQQFADVAAHDLREPIRTINSFTEMLGAEIHDKLNPDQQRYLKHILNASKRMEDLVSDLLAFSRINKKPLEPSPVEMNQVIDDCLLDLKTLLQESHARVTHDELPNTSGNPGQIRQLFQNLIHNGVKFQGGSNPTVHVGAIEQDEMWVFSVKDNGIGIKEEHADQIFMIFERLHTQSEYPGTGIGLALCKEIVERHGGKIWFSSVPSEGATFFFSLPKLEPGTML